MWYKRNYIRFFHLNTEKKTAKFDENIFNIYISKPHKNLPMRVSNICISKLHKNLAAPV